jgi:hypothetical protein
LASKEEQDQCKQQWRLMDSLLDFTLLDWFYKFYFYS